MKIKILFFINYLLIVNMVYATPQATDELLYNGNRYSLLQFPLESYFFKYPKKRPEITMSSAAWRGYRALFEIKSNKLYVININNMYFDGKNVITKCFNGLSDVFLNWWNGILIIPDGELSDSYKMESIYERLQHYDFYKFIEIKNGNVIKEYKLNNNQYRKYYSIIDDLYTKTEIFTELFWEDLEKEYDDIINELFDGILPDDLVEYIITNYKIDTSFFDYLPVIFYNDNTATPYIQEHLDEKLRNKNIKLLFLIGRIIGIIGIITIMLIVIKRRRKKMHNVA
jgi:hypothetical protein